MENNTYRIMIVVAKKDNNQSLYKYLLNEDGTRYEATTLEEIDAKIEKMLNEEDYSKSEFIVVNELEFDVFANVIDNTELREETTEEESGEGTEEGTETESGENSGDNTTEPTA